MADVKEQLAPDLTRIRPGHWRNLWHLAERVFVVSIGEIGPGEVLDEDEHVSREIAEQEALEYLERSKGWSGADVLRYLGPVFVPGDAHG